MPSMDEFKEKLRIKMGEDEKTAMELTNIVNGVEQAIDGLKRAMDASKRLGLPYKEDFEVVVAGLMGWMYEAHNQRDLAAIQAAPLKWVKSQVEGQQE